jgi:hypothetical protein
MTVKALELKAALRRTADESGLPHKAIADMLGVSYSHFQGYLDPSLDSHMPSHRLPTFLAICHDSSATLDYLAALIGAAVVRLPKPGSGEVLVLERRARA